MSEPCIEIQTPQGASFHVNISEASTVADLKKAASLHLRSGPVRLASSGQILQENDDILEIQKKGPVLAMIMSHARDHSRRQGDSAAAENKQHGAASPEDGDKDITVRLPANAPKWKQQLVRLLRQIHTPELLLFWLLSIRGRTWLTLGIIIALGPLASRLGLAPIYVPTVIIFLIFSNLGTRQAGEQSAYSIFNNFRTLPGQLTADEVDRQVRSGAA